MQPQWQQQMQREMAERQRQLESAAWLKQQADKKAQARKSQSDSTFAKGDKFTIVEAEVDRLKQDLAAGRLTEAQFRARLRELMVQDEHGYWWMVHSETGQWYCHDGTNWTRANLPGRRIAAGTQAQHLPESTTYAKPKPRRLLGAIILPFCLLLTSVAGLTAGEISQHLNFSPWLGAGIVWLIGIVVSFRLSRRVWRGR
jgi:hypothetical protein